MKNSVCVRQFDKMSPWLTDCILGLVLLYRNGILSGGMYCTPDSRKNMVLGDDVVDILWNS